MKAQEIRQATNRASRIHALLSVRDQAETEIATLLREELDAVGEAKWLEWCEQEFGWKRRAAYYHLNPQQLDQKREIDRERQSARLVHVEPAQLEPTPEDDVTGPTMKELYNRNPFTKVMLELAPLMGKWPPQRMLAQHRREYAKGHGLDITTKETLIGIRNWLNIYIDGLDEFIVSCSKD